MTEAMKNDRDHDEGPGTQPAGFAELADLSDPLLDVLADPVQRTVGDRRQFLVDPLDQRKRYLSLTEESRRQMDAILSRYPSAGMAVSTIEPQRYGWAGPSW